MARNFDSRLEKLRVRRQGPEDLRKGQMTWDGRFVPLEEAYQKRSTNIASTYALGAMQRVDPDYTEKSFHEGNRVRNQLEKRLAGVIPVEFDYQGSVPLDIHIRGVSDIDLLLLLSRYLVFDRDGPRANTYIGWDGPSGESLLDELRKHAEQNLINAFPEANVDTSGSKAITISGGSLQREVDVIPAHWYDTAAYQASQMKKDRGIYIYLKDERSRALNYPFLHMHHIQQKDDATSGGVKKIIRLLKTLVADYEEEPKIELSSYDIASIVWHFLEGQMIVQSWNELSLLWVAKVNLEVLVIDEQRTKSLYTPDGTRKIIDKEQKFLGLVRLLAEVNDLISEVVKELSGLQYNDREAVGRVLRESIV